MFDYKNNDYFALVKPIKGGWSFVSYEYDGKSYRAIQGFNRDGMPKNFTVFFGDRERIYMTPKNKTVQVIVNNDNDNVQTMKVSEYLRNSPYCVSATCTIPIFKLIDEEKDAQDIVDIKGARIKAESIAYELKGSELTELAQLLGEFSDDKAMQKRQALEYAGKFPAEFMKIYNDPNRKVKSLVRKAIKSGILKQNGAVVSWDKTILGSGEDMVVDFLVKDDVKLKALAESVKTFK